VLQLLPAQTDGAAVALAAKGIFRVSTQDGIALVCYYTKGDRPKAHKTESVPSNKEKNEFQNWLWICHQSRES
jgi:hypothetical protein